MSTDKEVFQAVIRAKDESGPAIAAVHERFRKLGSEADHVGRRIEHMHHPHVFAELGEHVNVTRERFGELHASIGEVGASLVELLPALGALGAVGSVAGLFEMAEHVSESFAQLAHTAASLGIATGELQRLNAVATLTDTNQESMTKSLGKLNRVIAETAGGHNKEVATTFHRLGINLRDANGHLRSASDILPQLADAFQKTGSAAARSEAANKLFGKSGADMIPLLMKGGANLKKAMGEAGDLTFNMSPYSEQLEHYADSMKKLGLVTHAFTDELGTKLTPILAPVVDHFVDWVNANRDWVSTGIADRVGELAHWVESVDWQTVGTELESWAHGAEHFVDEIGGAKTIAVALGGIIAYEGVKFAAGPIRDIIGFTASVGTLIAKISTEIPTAWATAGRAATAASEVEVAALGATEAATEAGVAGITAMSAGLAGLAASASVVLAGALIAYMSDSDDAIGRRVDRWSPKARGVDDFVYRHSWGLVGHPWAWADQETPDERKADIAGLILQRQMSKAPPLPGEDIVDAHYFDHVPVRQRAFVNYNDPPDLFSGEIDARRVAAARPRTGPMPSGELPGWPSSGLDIDQLSPGPLAQLNAPQSPQSPFQFTPFARFDQPSRVEGRIDATITLVGAPAGTTATLSSVTSGAVGPPSLTNHTGPMFPGYSHN